MLVRLFDGFGRKGHVVVDPVDVHVLYSPVEVESVVAQTGNRVGRSV